MGELDCMWALRSLVAGLIGHGPLSHLWYNFSKNLFNHILHWTACWSIVPKVTLDQGFWGSIWNNTYLLLLGLMKHKSLETIWNDAKQTMIPLAGCIWVKVVAIGTLHYLLSYPPRELTTLGGSCGNRVGYYPCFHRGWSRRCSQHRQ
jgi:hypothetical protein